MPLSIATTSATLGFNLNVTLQELYIETAYPMDPDSEKALLAIVSWPGAKCALSQDFRDLLQ